MEENKSNQESKHFLISGVPAHEFTEEERSKGGKASTFGALKHGKYAEKLSQKYICPNCNTPISAEKITEQDAYLLKLSKKEGIYEEIKKNVMAMKFLIDGEGEDRAKFTMLLKSTEVLLKLLERQSEQKESESMKGMLSLKEFLEGLRAKSEEKYRNKNIKEVNNQNENL